MRIEVTPKKNPNLDSWGRVWRAGCNYIAAFAGDMCNKCGRQHNQTASEADLLENRLKEFFAKIEHGDKAHREWLANEFGRFWGVRVQPTEERIVPIIWYQYSSDLKEVIVDLGHHGRKVLPVSEFRAAFVPPKLERLSFSRYDRPQHSDPGSLRI